MHTTKVPLQGPLPLPPPQSPMAVGKTAQSSPVISTGRSRNLWRREICTIRAASCTRYRIVRVQHHTYCWVFTTTTTTITPLPSPGMGEAGAERTARTAIMYCSGLLSLLVPALRNCFRIRSCPPAAWASVAWAGCCRRCRSGAPCPRRSLPPAHGDACAWKGRSTPEEGGQKGVPEGDIGACMRSSGGHGADTFPAVLIGE